MIPSTFDYEVPTSVAEAVALLREGSQVIGGGTWVVPGLNRGDARCAAVVDLRLAGLGGISQDGDVIRVGATCTYADLLASDLVAAHLPLLRTMAAGVTGGQQILNQGTLGGSVAAARPSSDAPAVVVALGGRLRIAGPDGERVVDAREFFVGPEHTVLGPRDIVVALDFPSARDLRWGYAKLKHGQSSWPIATAAVILGPADGELSWATLVLGGVAGTPVVEDITGEPAARLLTENGMAAAARLAAERITEPWSDVLAPADYRRTVAPVLAVRALRMAAAHDEERDA
jgi:carbon-monoxide dehydrogenase medium subunit